MCYMVITRTCERSNFANDDDDDEHDDGLFPQMMEPFVTID